MPETQFNKQAYLLSYFEDLSEVLKHKYRTPSWVFSLNTDKNDNFSKTISFLQNRMGVENFTKLKTYQYNGITPKIRLYRIDYNDQKQIIAQKQFVFEKDAKYTVESMLKPIKKDNCGIKSINWKLAGTNPVTAEKQIEVELQLYFDSINSFSGGSFDDMSSAWTKTKDKLLPFEEQDFKFCEFETTTKNYWSLLFHPKVEKDKYDTYKFRIKAEVGWEDIGENIKSQLNLTDVEESIKRLNYTFFLNLIKHQFNFNEDGSLVVVANYIASFESSTMNKQFDVLGGLQEKLSSIQNLTLGSLTEQTDAQREQRLRGQGFSSGPSDQQLIQELKNIGIDNPRAVELGVRYLSVKELSSASTLLNSLTDPEKIEKLKICGQDRLPTSIQALLDSPDVSTIQKSADVFSKLEDAAARQTQKFSDTIIKEFYSSLIDNLIQDKDYFSLWVNEDTQKKWLNWYNNISQNKPKRSLVSEGQKFGGNDAATLEAKKVLDHLRENIDNNENIEVKQLQENTQYQNPNGEIGTQIVFTTLGAVIDSAFKIVDKYLKSINDTSQLELNRLKIMLGDISDENIILRSTEPNLNGSSSSKFLNLSFIPVDIYLLKTFLIENIIKPKKTTYPLFSFIKDVMASLAVASVNSFENKNNNEVDKYANLSLGSTIITLGNSVDEDPMAEMGFSFVSDNLPLDQRTTYINSANIHLLEQYIVTPENNKNHKYFYTYFTIYDKNLTDFRPKNNVIEDEKQGVYHYTYAQDYGLVKSINFSKIDQPYLKEAKAVGKKTFYLGQFRDRYNADITMIGNNIYYPGMMLYISPSVEATIKTGNNASFSQISGIGGYYFVNQVESSITEDGYETKLKTIWQTDGYDLPNSIEDAELCKSFIKDLGLTIDLEDTLATALNNVVHLSDLQSLEDRLKIAQDKLATIYNATNAQSLLPSGEEERRQLYNETETEIQKLQEQIVQAKKQVDEDGLTSEWAEFIGPRGDVISP